MTGKRRSNTSDYHLRRMVGAHFFWLALVCILGAWWGRLVWKQGARIAELETELGWAKVVTESQWHRTQRMLYWESSFFFGLLLACTGLLFWLYWRDVKRARGLQAFFASVTHELRTPLTSIRLQAESIADTIADPLEEDSKRAQLEKNVRRLLEDTIRLEGQVERTLELARIEGGGPVYTQAVQLQPWLERFIQSWQSSQFGQSGQWDDRGRVEFKTEIEDVLIEADLAAIEIIFKNLIENSVRHSKRDRVLVSISVHRQDQGICVQIRDNGIGFVAGDPTATGAAATDAKDQQKAVKNLGEIFQKGETSQGTGVGLYLVKVLMTRMGGWARFASNTGFEVTLGFQEGGVAQAESGQGGGVHG